jgi:pimeloyl-ACP methyl ester carboxylesterase
VIWLNSGSEPHVGPGRAWVEYARALALRGRASLRLDFSGWGESPDRGHAPGRPYDPHGIEEAAAAVAALRGLGYERVVLAGLCAGAWVALRTVLEQDVTGVVALNPQLYWRPGDPVEALMRDTRTRRAAEREREARGGRLGVWTLLDRLGHRPWAGRWLDALAATGIPVLLCFAEGDDGLEYLRNRLGNRLARVTARGTITVVEIPDIDHSMHRAWLRERVVDAVEDFVGALA